MKKLKDILEDMQAVIGGSSEQTTDHEVEMAVTDLRAISDMANKLADHVQQQSELEGWVQAKITKSADYIQSVFKNLMYANTDLYEEKGTCCHKCGHVHVKGTSHPTPYFTGQKNCKNG
jgi:ribosomal protein L16 Arg81 hydroxylase|eukprot:GHVR01073256.1.p1 GENE.GHVR01073256.1~~GHVR01073256.1.p1  ORF type:complete len:119 (+),score=11.59 GHVR01073256.1:168-524(+)